jgi:hypothetical protein
VEGRRHLAQRIVEERHDEEETRFRSENGSERVNERPKWLWEEKRVAQEQRLPIDIYFSRLGEVCLETEV